MDHQTVHSILRDLIRCFITPASPLLASPPLASPPQDGAASRRILLLLSGPFLERRGDLVRTRPLLLAARVTPAEKELITAAAAAERVSLSEFILRACAARATMTISDGKQSSAA